MANYVRFTIFGTPYICRTENGWYILRLAFFLMSWMVTYSSVKDFWWSKVQIKMYVHMGYLLHNLIRLWEKGDSYKSITRIEDRLLHIVSHFIEVKSRVPQGFILELLLLWYVLMNYLLQIPKIVIIAKLYKLQKKKFQGSFECRFWYLLQIVYSFVD